MNKLFIASLALLSAPAAADIFKITGVRPVDVTEGRDFNSFRIDRPELLPTICPDDQIIWSTDLEVAKLVLGHILDIEAEGARFQEIQYKVKQDGQCHLWRFEREDPKVEWDISHLFLQPHVWHVTGADRLTNSGRLVSLGCPTYWNSTNYLYWQTRTNWGEGEGRMTGRWGDWCDSGEAKFTIPDDGHMEWRIEQRLANGTVVARTDWVTLEPTP